ncbi:Flp family type IVb pilin [Nocardioides terrisoli]|uniref:Flp family type IVb pilin n=1 Tax=Nocardioides terrisoli TaxID=3388267 RepID=UPI00287BA957|nr:Flp family type IVb pilin [Nocardioides marmorisolisilvae]
MPTGPTHDDTGASAVEYGLLITGIAAVIAAAVFLFGGAVLNLFSDSCQSVAAHVSTTCT